MSRSFEPAGKTPSATARRHLLKGVGLGLAGIAAAGTAASVAPSSAAAATGPISDTAIFQFALSLEYLGAEFYLRAVTGNGLPAALGGNPGAVTGGSPVPFQNTAIAFMAQKIAVDEQAHVSFFRTLLGQNAPAEPAIDLVNSWTTVALNSGLIVPGQTFNPFASETDFLLGAYILGDTEVTAYAGAAGLLTDPNNVAYGASILAVEGYHAGAIRQRLSEIGGGAATDAISALRLKLGGVGDNGTSYLGNPSNITDVDTNGQAFRRTTSQVLSIVYGGGNASGLFFPNGINGTITSVT